MSKLYNFYKKHKHIDTILLIQKGSFFIFLDKDALFAHVTFSFKIRTFSKECDHMCGFPLTSWITYAVQLLELKGKFDVAMQEENNQRNVISIQSNDDIRAIQNKLDEIKTKRNENVLNPPVSIHDEVLNYITNIDLKTANHQEIIEKLRTFQKRLQE